MGPPDQAAHEHATRRQPAEHRDHLGPRTEQSLVRIAPPVGEQDKIAPCGPPEHVVQPLEVSMPVGQRDDEVALRPRHVRMTVIDRRRRVAPLADREKPIGSFHNLEAFMITSNTAHMGRGRAAGRARSAR